MSAEDSTAAVPERVTEDVLPVDGEAPDESSLRSTWREHPVVRQLLGGVGAAFGFRVVGAVLAYGLQIWLARWLGHAGYGAYSLIVYWSLLIALPSVLGLDSATKQLLPAFLERGDGARANGLRRDSQRLALGASLLCIAIWSLVVLASGRPAASDRMAFIGGVVFLTPIVAVTSVQVALCRALHRIAFSQAVAYVLEPACILLGCGLLFAFHGVLGVREATLLKVLTSLLVAVLLAIYLRRVWPVAGAELLSERRKLLEVSVPFLFMMGFVACLGLIDTIMLGAMRGEEAAGSYTVAVKTAMLVAFAHGAVDTAGGPLISRTWARGDRSQVQRILTVAAWTTLLVALPACAVLLVWGDWFLGLFGDSFRNATPALSILVVGQLISSFAGLAGASLAMTGHQKECARILSISLGLNVVANWVAIPIWGLEGAAIASMLTTLFWNTWMVLLSRRRLGFNSTVLPWPVRRPAEEEG